MNKKVSFKVSIITLFALSLVTSCTQQTPNTRENISDINNISVSGRVEFPVSKFNTKALITDVAPKATVTLLFPPDHPTQANVAIATGLTDSSGNFTVTPGNGFSYVINGTYKLEAMKRVGNVGKDAMTVSTFLKWNGSGWDSITFPSIYINTKTTALVTLASINSANMAAIDTIGRIDVSSGASVPLDVQSSNISKGKIVFRSLTDNANGEIYTMNPDGSNVIRLLNDNIYDDFPSVSPDGTKIAFTSNRDGNEEIYIMNIDGSSQTRLTNNSSIDREPSWSATGAKLSFTSFRDANGEIYTMNVDGTSQANISNNSSDDKQSNWSKTGKIAFSTLRDGNYEIYTMNSDGSSPTRLTNNGSSDFFPSYSSTGTKISYGSFIDGTGFSELYTMNNDGSSQTRLTTNTSTDGFPIYSPDNSKIIFDTNRDGNFELYTMNNDGSSPTRLTNNAASDRSPSWAPFVIKAQTVNDVSDLVTTALMYNNDPTAYIGYANGEYKLIDPMRISQSFLANLNGSQEASPNNSTVTALGMVKLNNTETSISVSLTINGILSGGQTAAHIHGPADPGVNAPPIFTLPMGNFNNHTISVTPSQVAELRAGKWYINVHSNNFGAGEIRGQIIVTP